MAVFDKGTLVCKVPRGEMVHLPDNVQEGGSATDGYEWRMVTGWSMICDRFYGDPTDFVRSVRDKLSKLPHIPFSDTDLRDLIVLLERTALELRELIGED